MPFCWKTYVSCISALMTITVVKDTIKCYYLLKDYRETQETLKQIKTIEKIKDEKIKNNLQ